MSKPNRARRFFRQVLVWTLTAGFVYGVYRAYRWAEPSAASLNAVLFPHPASNINLELEGASFENFANGAKNWSLRAGRILLERPQNGGASNSLQSADIENIQDGKLFALPVKAGGGVSASGRPEERGREGGRALSAAAPSEIPLTQAGADADAGTPAATFSAQHGRYAVGVTDGLPPDLLIAYTVQWQFRLTGDVRIRTSEGYQLNAPSITLLELFNRRTAKTERQMLCEQGAQVKAKGASLQANQARYDDKTQAIECVGGVRAAMQKDSVQADSMHWSLKDEVIRCPEAASGVWQNIPFTAVNLVVDVKRHRYRGDQVELQLSQDKFLDAKLP